MRKILALIGAFSFGNVAAANGEDWFAGALIGAITVGLLPDLFRVFKLLCSFLVWFYCFVSLLLNLFRMFKGFVSEKAKIFREAGDVSPPLPRRIRGSEVVHKIDVASSSRQPDESQGRRIGEKIPYPPSSKFVLDAPSNRGSEKVPPVTSSKFVLDPAKIEALARETDEIQSILSEKMAELEPSVSAKDQECRVEQELVAWLSELDTRYHTALLAIIKHNLISTEDFDALAAREHLISEDLFNTINSWSDDALGDFLLEKSEDILIRKELLLNIPVLVADYQYDN